MLTVIHHFVLKGLDTADTDAVNDTDAGHVFLLQIDTSILHTLNGTDHSQLGATIHLASLLAVNVIIDVKILHLAGKCRLEV